MPCVGLLEGGFMRSILFRLRTATIMAAGLTASCGTSATAPGPSIEVDRAACESRFTTVATFGPDTTLEIRALAVGPDGTLFFTNDGAAARRSASGSSAPRVDGRPAGSIAVMDRHAATLRVNEAMIALSR